MALNPPILPSGVPIGIPGEYFLLAREGIDLKLSFGRDKFSAKGELFLTTQRITFVARKPARSSGLVLTSFVGAVIFTPQFVAAILLNSGYPHRPHQGRKV